MSKTSEAQVKASREWEKKNPEKAKYGSYKRTARLFIRKHMTLDDVEELRSLIDERIEELKGGQ